MLRLYDVFLIVFTLLYIGMIQTELLCLALQRLHNTHSRRRGVIIKNYFDKVEQGLINHKYVLDMYHTYEWIDKS